MNQFSRVFSFIVIVSLLESCVALRKCKNAYTEKCMSLNIEMVEVQGGIFKMGGNREKIGCQEDEVPVHSVVLNSFYISMYEITFSQYDLFCEDTGHEKPYDNGWGRGNRPVINVNWYDAVAFCEWLTQKSGQVYRLPTEAEWEYAARGGKKSKNFLYAGSRKADKVAWYSEDINNQPNDRTTFGKTQLVGQKNPNELNIYDMSGNVWEWCSDGYNSKFYAESQLKNPKGLGIAPNARGGSWFNEAEYCLTTNRDYDAPDVADNDLGFRIVKINQ